MSVYRFFKGLGHVGSIEGSLAQALPKLQAAAAHSHSTLLSDEVALLLDKLLDMGASPCKF